MMDMHSGEYLSGMDLQHEGDEAVIDWYAVCGIDRERGAGAMERYEVKVGCMEDVVRAGSPDEARQFFVETWGIGEQVHDAIEVRVVPEEEVRCVACGGVVEPELVFPFDPVCGSCVADYEAREDAGARDRIPA